MKRVFIICMVTVCMPVLVHAKATWVPFIPGTNGASPQIEVLESNATKTIVHITIPGMYVEDTLVNGTTYSILSIPQYSTRHDIGAPQVPSVRELIAIPPISDASITVQEITSMTLENYLVYPCQKPVPQNTPPEPFYLDTLIYKSNALYPDQNAEVNDPAILKDMRVVSMSSYPVLFNPVKRELKIMYDFKVTISYHGINNINPLPYGYPIHVDPMYDAMYKDLIINYEWLGIESEFAPVWDYLIITAAEYYADLQDFVFWKHKKGCMVKIVQPANIVFPRNYFIQDDTTAIKTYIRNTLHIGETDKLCYVLLVGDENDVPMFNRYDYCSPNQYIWSDHYYACIEGTDSIADIAIGRLSVDNTSHVTTIVNKVFAYERNPAEDWAINRALMVSHYEEEGTYFGDTTQKIIDDILEPYNFDYYDADGRENWTNDDLKECIENNGSPYHAWIITLLSMIVVV